jgi:hypothetical protein
MLHVNCNIFLDISYTIMKTKNMKKWHKNISVMNLRGTDCAYGFVVVPQFFELGMFLSYKSINFIKLKY